MTLLALLAQLTPTATATPAATDGYSFVLAPVATPAVGNLLAALAALISAAAAYLVWRTRQELSHTKTRLDQTQRRLDDRVDRLAATTRVPPPSREAPP